MAAVFGLLSRGARAGGRALHRAQWLRPGAGQAEGAAGVGGGWGGAAGGVAGARVHADSRVRWITETTHGVEFLEVSEAEWKRTVCTPKVAQIFGEEDVIGMIKMPDGTIKLTKTCEEFDILAGLKKPAGEEDQEDPVVEEFLALMDEVEDLPGLPPAEDIIQVVPGLDVKAKRREMEMDKQKAQREARVRKVDELGRAYGTGYRKDAIAQVWIKEGTGAIHINSRPMDNYFPQFCHRHQVLLPLRATDTLGKFDIIAKATGGGMTGQAGAVRLGLARALQNFDPDVYRPPLRKEKLLTRDVRIVERKKPGKAKARKSFQWVKR